MTRSILIACVGNIFLGDDGFGVEVARHLAGLELPGGVVVRDFGIRGFDLTYALLDPWDLVILVDACARGGEPGDVYLIEPDAVDAGAANGNSASGNSASGVDTHGMSPMNVLRMARSMGGERNRMLIVGCEPADFGPEEEGKLGLSEPVTAAVEKAVALIGRLVSQEQVDGSVDAAGTKTRALSAV